MSAICFWLKALLTHLSQWHGWQQMNAATNRRQSLCRESELRLWIKKKKENRWWFLFEASERRRQTAIAAANPDFSNLRLALPIPTWYQNCQWHRFDEREIKNCCLSSCSKSEDKIVNLLCPLYQWFNLGIELGKALQIALTVWETVKGWKCSLPSKCQNSLGDCQKLEMKLA